MQYTNGMEYSLYSGFFYSNLSQTDMQCHELHIGLCQVTRERIMIFHQKNSNIVLYTIISH